MNSMLNDFSHLQPLPNLTYKIDEQSTQFIEVLNFDTFIITITIPEDVFEWFISISDIQKEKELISDWVEHYGSPKDVLKAERQESIEKLVQQMVEHRIRLNTEKQPGNIESIELLINENWVQFGW